MAAIGAANVTYALQGKVSKDDASFRHIILNITFGDGALTYPAGGIPLTAGKMGCPSQIKSFSLVSPASANGFVYKYDLTNNKLRIYQGDNPNVAAAPLIELSGAAAPAAATLTVEVVGY